MRTITINLVTEDHDGTRLAAEGPLMVSEEEYAYFLKDGQRMLYYCGQRKRDAVNKILKTAYAKIGKNINSEYDLKHVIKRYYSEDGKLHASSAASYYFGEHYRDFDDSDPRAIQNYLRDLIKIAGDKFAEELASQDK